jgi:DNA-binding transcriptional LysR family regulator
MVIMAGGVRRAAERMNLSQPAVTARIKNLEDMLSVQLFDRSTPGMPLTKRGRRLLRYAEQCLQLDELIQRDVADPSGLEEHLCIGASETVVQTWLPGFIAALRQIFPKLQVEIVVDVSVNLREALLNRSIDLAILMGPVSEYTVENVALPAFPLRWYQAAERDLPTDPEALFLSNPIVTYARNTRPYRELKRVLHDRYGPEVVLFPSSSLSACFRLVAAGLGVGALPEALARAEIEAGRLREFDPGWHPKALGFTASYLSDPGSAIAARAALMAEDVARAACDRNS